jgi:hypothetical protein
MTATHADRADHTGAVVGCPACAQEAATAGFRVGSSAVVCPTCGRSPAEGEVMRVTETAEPTEPTEPTGAQREAIDGRRSVEDTRRLLDDAVTARLRSGPWLGGEDEYWYCWVVDFTDEQVVFRAGSRHWQAPYTITDEGTVGTVSLGDPVEVVAQQWFVPAPSGTAAAGETAAPPGSGRAVETVTERIPGRVLEAKGVDSDGGRVYRVRIIAAGESRNGRIYPINVLHAASGLYEGAKAYDHHRDTAEMASGTIRGLIGWYSDVEAAAEGVEADLHLLPSAAHAAEALDAAIATQAEGREPLVGLSHDVQATFRQIQTPAGRRMEAVSIVTVNSADVVAHPAAGGAAQRAVAGGIDPTCQTDPAAAEPSRSSRTSEQETDVPDVTTEGVLEALKTASDEQLAAVGLRKAATETQPAAPTPPTQPTRPAGATETQPTNPAAPHRAAEVAGFAKTEFMGRMLIRSKVADAGLPEAVAEAVTDALPDRITEADVDAQIAGLKAALAVAERSGLTPTAAAEGVTQEAREKKVAALDAFFAGEWGKGYRSFREAFVDFTGARPRSFDEDFNRTILTETIGSLYDSARSTESLDSTSWAQALGDSVTRRMIAMYRLPGLQSWRRVVSMMPPINDFRTQRVARVGGYGVLPGVNEGAPYQPLTSPGDEESTYAITKRGGTEDLTLEMVANDDVRAISNIPNKLGRAASQTLYRFVWDFFANNVTCTYDTTAFFHTNHGNTATSAALSQTTLTAARVAMRSQAAFGDTSEILSLVPSILAVPNELEEIAFQLSRSAVAIPSTPAGPSDTPNIHAGLEVVVVDYWTDANDWFAVADPANVPGIEVGFYRGREEPELFTQSDPTQGSAFSSDSITWKIRHIYGGTVTDHRVAYRGQG